MPWRNTVRVPALEDTTVTPSVPIAAYRWYLNDVLYAETKVPELDIEIPSDGAHQLAVGAVDAGGNEAEKGPTWAFALDHVAPPIAGAPFATHTFSWYPE